MPLVLALSEGSDWGWTSAATLGCLAISVVGAIAFVIVEGRVPAPLVDLALLRNAILVGATLAILIVAGTINALMYVLSLYFQDPAGFGMSALEAGRRDAARRRRDDPDHAADHAARRQDRHPAWRSPAASDWRPSGSPSSPSSTRRGRTPMFVLPLAVLSAGLGLANGPASSASTQRRRGGTGRPGVGHLEHGPLRRRVAVGGRDRHDLQQRHRGPHRSGRLARRRARRRALARGSLFLAICAGAGIALVLLMARHKQVTPRAIDRAAAAAVTTHTLPTRPRPAASVQTAEAAPPGGT